MQQAPEKSLSGFAHHHVRQWAELRAEFLQLLTPIHRIIPHASQGDSYAK
jgi:hypothetical protein